MATPSSNASARGLMTRLRTTFRRRTESARGPDDALIGKGPRLLEEADHPLIHLETTARWLRRQPLLSARVHARSLPDRERRYWSLRFHRRERHAEEESTAVPGPESPPSTHSPSQEATVIDPLSDEAPGEGRLGGSIPGGQEAYLPPPPLALHPGRDPLSPPISPLPTLQDGASPALEAGPVRTTLEPASPAAVHPHDRLRSPHPAFSYSPIESPERAEPAEIPAPSPAWLVQSRPEGFSSLLGWIGALCIATLVRFRDSVRGFFKTSTTVAASKAANLAHWSHAVGLSGMELLKAVVCAVWTGVQSGLGIAIFAMVGGGCAMYGAYCAAWDHCSPGTTFIWTGLGIGLTVIPFMPMLITKVWGWISSTWAAIARISRRKHTSSRGDTDHWVDTV